MRIALVALSGLAASLASAPASRAQSTTVIVAGVADAETGRALEGAQVRLPMLGREARTDWAGEAKFPRVEPGRHWIEARLIGYAPAKLQLPVSGDTVGAVFMLAKLQLDTVRIAGTAGSALLPSEFVRRSRLGVGNFLHDTLLAKEKERSIIHMLPHHLPGLQVVPDHDRAGMYFLKSRRVRGNVSTPGNRGALDFGPCGVDVYLDRQLVDWPEYENLRPKDLVGVELYTMESAPPEYRKGTGSCQVLLLWTRY